MDEIQQLAELLGLTAYLGIDHHELNNPYASSELRYQLIVRGLQWELKGLSFNCVNAGLKWQGDVIWASGESEEEATLGVALEAMRRGWFGEVDDAQED